MNTNHVNHVDDQSDQGLQNTGVQEAIDSLDEVTKVLPEDNADNTDTRGVIVGDIKPLLAEELDKIANCLVQLKCALEAAPGSIVSPCYVLLCLHVIWYY